MHSQKQYMVQRCWTRRKSLQQLVWQFDAAGDELWRSRACFVWKKVVHGLLPVEAASDAVRFNCQWAVDAIAGSSGQFVTKKRKRSDVRDAAMCGQQRQVVDSATAAIEAFDKVIRCFVLKKGWSSMCSFQSAASDAARLAEAALSLRQRVFDRWMRVC
jgi:hypothetical protein